MKNLSKIISFLLLNLSALCQTNPIIIGGYMECNGGQHTGYLPFEKTHNLRAFFWTSKDQIDLFPKDLTVNFYTKKDKKLVFTYKLRRVYVFENIAYTFPIVCNSIGQKPVHNIQYSDRFNIPENLKNEDLILVAEPVCCRDLSDNFKTPNSNKVLLLNLAPYNNLSLKKTFIQVTPTIASAESMEVCAGQNFSFRNYAWANTSNITSVKYEFTNLISNGSQNGYAFVDYEKDFLASNLTKNLDSKLTINANGFISGKENKPGKYTYVIKVSGYQDTLKICEIFNEFQLIVKDCPQQTTPSIFTSKINKPLITSPLTICQDSLMQLNVKNNTKNGNFQWLKNGSPIVGAIDSIFVVKNNEAGQYSLKISNPAMCNTDVNSNTISINFHAKPNASASSEIPTNALCQGGTIKLTSLTNIANVQHQWYIGNNAINNATSSNYEALESGTYSIKITSPAGCSNFSNQLNIISNTLPIAEITSTNKVICKDSAVTLMANGDAGNTYEWFKDGNSLNIRTLNYKTLEAGSYSVKITSINTCSKTSSPFVVAQKEKPLVSILNPNGPQLCQGTTMMLNTSGLNIKSYQWYKDGQIQTGEISSSLEVSSSGNYSVAIIDTNNCSNTSSSENIILVNKVDVKIDTIPPICGLSSNLIPLNGTPIGGIFSGNGVVGSSFNPSIAGTGLHQISYSIINSNSCLSGSSNQDILVSAIPTIAFPHPDSGKICTGDYLKISPFLQNATTFKWYKDNNLLVGENGSYLETNQSGSYQLEAYSSENCSIKSSDFQIQIFPRLNVYLDSIQNFCGSQFAPINLNGIPSGGVFTGNGVLGNQFHPKIAGVGEHTIIYKVDRFPDCSGGLANRKVLITSPPKINLGESKYIIDGDSIQLNGSIGAGYFYNWSPNIGLNDSNIPSPLASPTQSITYVLHATGPNDCFASDSITINVVKPIFIPNSFSPNGDGINDSWSIKGIENYPKASVKVFNRWGNLLFETTNYTKNEFVGLYMGIPLPAGLYIYSIDGLISGDYKFGELLILH